MTHQHDDEQIEGLIFKEPSNIWVWEIYQYNGQKDRYQIDYCPWCGKKLE
jgi:hypothetical protein